MIPGINPASAAWWTMASHLAAQDYLARLQGAAGLPGFAPGAESLLPPYPASLLNPPSLSSHKSSKCKYRAFILQLFLHFQPIHAPSVLLFRYSELIPKQFPSRRVNLKVLKPYLQLPSLNQQIKNCEIL